jgi:hypothetical protein
MGKRVRVSMLLAVPWLLATAPAAFAQCPRASSVRVLAHSEDAMVYERKYGATYGCLRRTGRPHRLNRPSEFGGFNGVDTVRFAGHFVAFQEDFDSAAGGSAYVLVVRNLLTGALVTESDVSERSGGYGDSSQVVLLKPNGAVAWLAATGSADEERYFLEVHMVDHDRRGRWRQRLLDQSDSVHRYSLKSSADRRHITWRHGDTTRSATFR